MRCFDINLSFKVLYPRLSNQVINVILYRCEDHDLSLKNRVYLVLLLDFTTLTLYVSIFILLELPRRFRYLHEKMIFIAKIVPHNFFILFNTLLRLIHYDLIKLHEKPNKQYSATLEIPCLYLLQKYVALPVAV